MGRVMKIRYRLNPSNPCFSFEFYPPKTDEGTQALLRTVEELAPLEPGFVSVTYGAGGSTRERTLGNDLSWLRRFAVTLLKRHPIKDSLRGKMLRCLMNTQFLTEVLTLQRN